MAQFGQTQQPPFSTWDLLSEQLRQDYEVQDVDLSSGQVPADVDVLLVVAPQQMGDTERYAIDQYLMRGGATIIAGSNYRVTPDPFSGTLALTPIEDGLREMLDHYGIEVQNQMVMDPQNEPFPIAVTRDVGGFQVQEYQSINYPFFVDVRSDGMSQESSIIANLPAVTLNWVSPLEIDESKNENREVVTLMSSTETSWLNDSTDIQPDTELYPEMGFPIGEEQATYPLAVSINGAFESYFAEQESPLLAQDQAVEGEPPPESPAASASTITVSPETARLVVIGSGDFLNDTVFNISSQISLDRYLNSLQFVQNAVDWSVEDLDLLNIRSRGAHARVLDPLETSEQTLWESINYGFALLALVVIGILWTTRRRSERPMELI